MRIWLFLVSTLMFALFGTACGSKTALGSETKKDSKKEATLRQTVEELSGAAGKVDVPILSLTSTTICSELSITGELVPEKAVIVKPLMEGRITFLRPLKVGDIVKKDEVVAKIDDRDIEDEIEQQERQIEITAEKMKLDEDSLAQRRKSLEFDRQLCEKSFISRNELEKSEMEVKQAEISLRQSQIGLQQEKSKLARALRQREKVAVKAPISGMVVLASHLTNEGQSGSLVSDDILAAEGTQVGSTTPLFGILSQEGFLAQCMVNGKDVARLALGQKVKATVISHKPIDVTGKVIRLSNIQDQKSHAHKVAIALDTMDPSFTSGLFVRANVELERHDFAYVVDREYVKEKDNRYFVQLAVNGMVRDIYTTLGLTQGNLVELAGGVQTGDQLIASKEMYAADQMVNPVKIDPKTEEKR